MMKNAWRAAVFSGAIGVFGFSVAQVAGTAQAFGSKNSEEKIWVTRPDGSKSCEKDSGDALDVGAAAFNKAGIKIFASQKVGDGKMHPMLCGSITGRQNAYQISASERDKATAIGYAPATAQTAPALFR